MKIAAVGGTGLIGSGLAGKLHETGHHPMVASPKTGVNSLTGDGLHEALRGAQVLVDVTNAPEWDDEAVMHFFQASTRNLLAAAAAAAVGHYVALSVVGTERLTESGYFRAKIIQERLIEDSSIPYSIVRTTQCFECMTRIIAAATDGNAVRLPPALVQPITADDVASALAKVAVGAPLNGMIEIAGPAQFRLDDLIRRLLTTRSDSRQVITDPQARFLGIAPRERTLLPEDNARLGQTDFDNWITVATAAQQMLGVETRCERTASPSPIGTHLARTTEAHRNDES
jgi:uncharacterized protein YbjT (DUF2867 family)